MLDGIALAFATPGLFWVIFVTFMAGLVYGFVGFGAALIFMPLATIVLPPGLAVVSLQISALISVLTVLPAAYRDADRPQMWSLLVASLIAAPFGVWALATLPGDLIRWSVSVIVAVTLAGLMSGLRYRTRPGLATLASVGGAAGAMGGATGLNGPMVILFQLGGQASARQVRGTMICFLTLNSLFVIPYMIYAGIMTWPAVWLGLLLIAPYGAGTLLGKSLFSPRLEGIYRRTAYAIIGLAVILGLPIWS